MQLPVEMGVPACSTFQFQLLLQMNGLRQCAVSSRIPQSKTNPFLARGIEGQAELSASERSHILQTDQLAVHFSSVAPDQFSEFRRKRPLHLRVISFLFARTLNGPVSQKHLTTGHE